MKIYAGALSLAGSILADGTTTSNSGGGSGGGIQVNVGTISGNGTIRARGGSASDSSGYYGAGGGGRIAVYYGIMTLPQANITAPGGVSDGGGTAARNGSTGTVYLSPQ